jgi:hypothetical protein
MRTWIIAAALLVLAGGSAAVAQSGSSTVAKNPTSADKPAVQAPVGHRQPRAGQVPSEKNLSDPNDPANREDAELDRKIKSICRGC